MDRPHTSAATDNPPLIKSTTSKRRTQTTTMPNLPGVNNCDLTQRLAGGDGKLPDRVELYAFGQAPAGVEVERHGPGFRVVNEERGVAAGLGYRVVLEVY